VLPDCRRRIAERSGFPCASLNDLRKHAPSSDRGASSGGAASGAEVHPIIARRDAWIEDPPEETTDEASELIACWFSRPKTRTPPPPRPPPCEEDVDECDPHEPFSFKCCSALGEYSLPCSGGGGEPPRCGGGGDRARRWAGGASVVGPAVAAAATFVSAGQIWSAGLIVASAARRFANKVQSVCWNAGNCLDSVSSVSSCFMSDQYSCVVPEPAPPSCIPPKEMDAQHGGTSPSPRKLDAEQRWPQPPGGKPAASPLPFALLPLRLGRITVLSGS